MNTWELLFEKVIVPIVGLALIVLASLGGPVPQSLYPFISGLLLYPGAREWDRRRRARNGGVE